MANKITDEELKEIEANDRHDELINALKAIPDKESSQRHDELIRSLQSIAERSNVNELILEAVNVLKAIESKELPQIDIQPVIKELSTGIAELKAALEVKPKAFKIERSNVGFIERIIPEY